MLKLEKNLDSPIKSGNDNIFLFFLITIFLSFPLVSIAETHENVFLSWPEIISPEIELVSEVEATFQQSASGFLLKTAPGVVYIVHPFSPSDRKFEELRLLLATDKKIEITVIPNVKSSAYFTYELQEEVPPTSEAREITFSINHAYFNNAVDVGIKITAANGANILIQRIWLQDQTFFAKLLQPVKDYFHTAPYSGFTVNVFPIPRVFGRSAFLYFFPLFLALFALLFARKFRKFALLGLVILWLITDFRMNYEFGSYIVQDYLTWTRPAAAEKTFRTYGDFYVFKDWLIGNLPKNTKTINFYYLPNEHFPRILQYYLYPIMILPSGVDSNVFAVYHRADLKDALLETGGEITATFKDDSFIFIEK